MSETVAYKSADGQSIFVEDPLLRELLNHEGLIQIGTMVYKTTTTHIIYTHADNISALNNIQAKSNLSALSDLSHELVFHEIERPDFYDHYDQEAVEYWLWNDHDDDDMEPGSAELTNLKLRRTEKYGSSKNRRMIAEMWNTNWWYYSSIGVSTKNVKQGFLGFWGSSPADVISTEIIHFDIDKKMKVDDVTHNVKFIFNKNSSNSFIKREYLNESVSQIRIDQSACMSGLAGCAASYTINSALNLHELSNPNLMIKYTGKN